MLTLAEFNAERERLNRLAMGKQWHETQWIRDRRLELRDEFRSSKDTKEET